MLRAKLKLETKLVISIVNPHLNSTVEETAHFNVKGEWKFTATLGLDILKKEKVMAKKCIQANVTGKVQGVFFRDKTVKKAKELQLTGWVKNDPSGSVSLAACGEEEQLSIFIEWLWQGPQAAQVSNVKWNETPLTSFDNFKILF